MKKKSESRFHKNKTVSLHCFFFFHLLNVSINYGTGNMQENLNMYQLS